MRKTAAALLLLLGSWPAQAVCPNWNVVQPRFHFPQHPIMVDMDGDGSLDAVGFGRSIGVTWGPDYQTSTLIRADATFDSVAVGDFDGDGRLDLAGAVPRVGATMEIFFNLGDRHFEKPRFLFTWNLLRLARADLDGDRFSDLIAITDVSNEVVTLRGNGSGDFETPVPLHLGARPAILIGADFDGDRRTDAAFVDNQADNVLRTTLGWSFSAPGSIKTAVLTDFDRDGRPDLALVAGDRAVLLRNTSSGFESMAELVPGRPATDVALADFNHDGTIDVAVSATNGIAVWLYEAGIGFRRVADTPLSPAAGITALDYNGDGIPDLSVGNPITTILPGLGNGTFAVIRPMEQQAAYIAAAADVDGDGDTDFAAAGQGVGLWRNDRGTLVREAVSGLTKVEELKIADLDGDGVQELIVSTSDPGSRTILVYRSSGGLWFSLPADRGYYGIAVGDFDGDGRKEIAVRANGVVELFAATPQPHAVGQFAGLPNFEPRFAADFDHDGRDDLILFRQRTVGIPFPVHNDGAVALLSWRDGFAFPAPVLIADNVTATDINIGDFDGDGNRDVAIALEGALEIAYGDGRDSFSRAAVPTYPISPFSFPVAVVADLDGDGRDELLGNDGDVVAVFLGDRGKAPRRTVVVQAAVRFAFAVGQVDGDGLDIVTFDAIHPGICAPSAHRRPR